MSPDHLALWATSLSSTHLLRIRVALESVGPQVQHHQSQYQLHLLHQWNDDAQDGASFLVKTLRTKKCKRKLESGRRTQHGRDFCLSPLP